MLLLNSKLLKLPMGGAMPAVAWGNREVVVLEMCARLKSSFESSSKGASAQDPSFFIQERLSSWIEPCSFLRDALRAIREEGNIWNISLAGQIS